MRHIKIWARHIAGALTVALLVACGGGSGSAFVPQFNVTERELYEPVRADAGIVAQRGSGGISLQLEAASGTALPLGGDTASVGVDKFYFNLINTGYINLSMSPRMLQVIDAVELYDANKQLLWRADATNREINNFWLERLDFSKPAPRYEVRIIAAAGAIDSSQVIVWFGDGLVNTANVHDQAKISPGSLVSCANCNLSGMQLGAYKLEAAYLPGANLRNAWLVRVLDPTALSLDELNLFKILWDNTQVAGAKMKSADLAGVDFTGAIVTGAGHSPADFEASHLFQTIFNGVNLDGVNMNAAFMDRTQLISASMIGALLNNAQMAYTNFSGSNLYKAQFKKAMLTGTNFSNANLAGADFSGALIQDANFTGADLSGATWTDGRICATPSRDSCRQILPP